jgi:hypothetical protein
MTRPWRLAGSGQRNHDAVIKAGSAIDFYARNRLTTEDEACFGPST